MYILKESCAESIRVKYKARFLANEIGKTESYMSQLLNRKINCTKTVAYALTKFFDSEAEIENFFERVM